MNNYVTLGHSIHNTRAGVDPDISELLFKSTLEVMFKNVLSSDTVPDRLYNILRYDPSKDKINDRFNAVLLINKLHTVPVEDRIPMLTNLYNTVARGGYLVVTFDLDSDETKLLYPFTGSGCTTLPNKLDNWKLLILQKDENI